MSKPTLSAFVSSTYFSIAPHKLLPLPLVLYEYCLYCTSYMAHYGVSSSPVLRTL